MCIRDRAFYPETLPLICRTFRRQCRKTFRISELDPTGFGLARSEPDAPRLRPLNAAQSSIILLQSRLSPSGEERWKCQNRQDRTYWLLPGGGVERVETLAEGTAREVNEECGAEITVLASPLGLVEVISPDGGETRHLIQLT